MVLLQNLTYIPSEGGIDSYMRALAENCPGVEFQMVVWMAKVAPGDALGNVSVLNVSRRWRIPRGVAVALTRLDLLVGLLLCLDGICSARSTGVSLVVCRHPLFLWRNVWSRPVPTVYLLATALPVYLKTLVPSGGGSIVRRIYVGVKAALYRRVERGICLKGNVAVLSRKKQEEVSSYYGLPPERIRVIPPGASLRRFRFVVRVPPAKGQSVKVVVVARLSPEKNIGLLVRAASAFPGELTIDVVGDGPVRGELEQLVRSLGLESSVNFWGFRDDVPERLADAHVFVLPSTYEGFGHVLLEAMATGLPCVALDPRNGYNVASDEVITDRVDGVLIPNDSAEVVAAVRWLTSDPIRYAEIANAARGKAERFSWVRHLQALREFSGMER